MGVPLIWNGGEWQRVGNEVFKSITAAERGVWGVKSDGTIRYRQGVSKSNPSGLMWVVIDGANFAKVVIGPMNRIMAIKRDRNLMIRTGITRDFPIGAGWKKTEQIVQDASIGDYGIWIVNYFGILQFAPISMGDDLSTLVLRWRDVSSKMKSVHAGHGSSLWSIRNNGSLVKRKGISMDNPIGDHWETSDGVTTSVSTSVHTVYRTVANSTVLYREGMPFWIRNLQVNLGLEKNYIRSTDAK